MAAGIVAMTIRMVRDGAFRPRLNIEVQDDPGRGRTFFTIELAKGQVIVPVADATCRVDIEFT